MKFATTISDPSTILRKDQSACHCSDTMQAQGKYSVYQVQFLVGPFYAS